MGKRLTPAVWSEVFVPSASQASENLLIQEEVLAAHWAASVKHILPSALTVIVRAV